MDKLSFKKELKGERLVLKEHLITFEHAREAFKIIENNREIFEKYFSWAEKTKTAEDYFEHFLLGHKGKMDTGEVAEYAIYLDNKFIGQIGFFNISFDTGEIGYWLDNEYTGNGYMQEAIKTLENYMFDLGFFRIQIRHDSHNLRSENAINKAGYSKEGVSRGSSIIQGTRYDRSDYSKLKSEWEKE